MVVSDCIPFLDEYLRNIPKNPVRRVKEEDANAEFRYYCIIITVWNSVTI